MTKSRSYLLAEVIDGEPNAETRIERLRTFEGPGAVAPAGHVPGSAADGDSRRRALYRLEPHSGKTHQLRVHMASLGLGIVNSIAHMVLPD